VLSHIGEAFVVGSRIEMAGPSKIQKAAVALSDRLIAEVIAADTSVIASPMFYFGPKTTLRLASTIYCGRS
jgi:FMN-dependent NADH-azoreductase